MERYSHTKVKRSVTKSSMNRLRVGVGSQLGDNGRVDTHTTKYTGVMSFFQLYCQYF